MGIKRRKRETAIADPGLHKRGGQILAAIFERPFFYVSSDKISDFCISPKNFIIYLRKISDDLFFKSSTFSVLQLEQKNYVRPLEFGGAKSFLFRDLGGLAPPSPYVEPPLP